MRALLVVLAILAAAAPVRAADESACAVKYLSAEHVYLDCGRLGGLEEGMTVRIVRDGKEIATLQVEYAADHSATCKVLQAAGEIRTGDKAVFEGSAPAAGAAAPAAGAAAAAGRERDLRAPDRRAGRAESPGPKLTGSAALRWDHGQETGGTEVSSDVFTVPFRLRVRDLGAGWDFRGRGSVRRIRRGGGAGSRPESEWRNRIHELALVHDGRRDDWHLAVGRIGVRAAAAAGPFDGLAVDRRVGAGLRVGAFAGWAPAWQDMDFSTEDELVGLSLQRDPLGVRGEGLGLLLSGVGRYHQGEVSREYLALTTTWRGGPGLSFLQAAEVDMNRNWKRDSGASSVELTSFALTGRWQANRRVALMAGYDDRDPVRTWESRELPDSLFQDAGRKGFRGGVELRDGSGKRLNLDASLRTPDNGEPDATSWGARAFLPAWPVPTLDLDVSVRGFSGPVIGGFSPALGVSHRTRSGWYLRGNAGLTRYKDQVGDDDRGSTWLGAMVEKILNRHWSLMAEGRLDWGDGTESRNLALEARCRF